MKKPKRLEGQFIQEEVKKKKRKSQAKGQGHFGTADTTDNLPFSNGKAWHSKPCP